MEQFKVIGIIVLLVFANIAFGQTDKEKAYRKGSEAIELMDNGKIKESLKLLKEAAKLDPESFTYPYEMAYANYANGDYKKASKILEKNKNHKNVNDRLYQLLGNSYDMMGNPDKAFDAYDEGLRKFPKSGSLYLEKGNVYWIQKKYIEALSYYEEGIKVDPTHPSNYYRATLIYLSTSEEVWGMIYGEIFMNLERNSKRTSEISKRLFNTYKREIKFTSDSTMSVSFSKNANISISDLSDTSNIKLPYGIGVYEPTYLTALINETSITIASLDRIRTTFNKSYYEGGKNVSYPNILFDYQKTIIEAGHFQAYNYWILMKGDEEEFDKWQTTHQDQWDDFIKWFTDNGLSLNSENKFYTEQY